MVEFKTLTERICEICDLMYEPEIECYSDTLEITGGYYYGCEVTVNICDDHYALFAISYDDIAIHEATSLDLTASMEDIEEALTMLSREVYYRYKARHK